MPMSKADALNNQFCLEERGFVCKCVYGSVALQTVCMTQYFKNFHLLSVATTTLSIISHVFKVHVELSNVVSKNTKRLVSC